MSNTGCMGPLDRERIAHQEGARCASKTGTCAPNEIRWQLVFGLHVDGAWTQTDVPVLPHTRQGQKHARNGKLQTLRIIHNGERLSLVLLYVGLPHTTFVDQPSQQTLTQDCKKVLLLMVSNLSGYGRWSVTSTTRVSCRHGLLWFLLFVTLCQKLPQTRVPEREYGLSC